LILANKAWEGLQLRQAVEVEHVVVDPREMQVHGFELNAAAVRSTLEWLHGNEYRGKEPWPTTSLVRIARRLATAKDVERVSFVDMDAADALRADVAWCRHEEAWEKEFEGAHASSWAAYESADSTAK
jgi:hypothetical protein